MNLSAGGRSPEQLCMQVHQVGKQTKKKMLRPRAASFISKAPCGVTAALLFVAVLFAVMHEHKDKKN